MDNQTLAASQYFLQRLNQTSQASDLPPSAQFDLASSSLSDSHLEQASSYFGAPSGIHGWGFSQMFDHLLSSQPDRVPVTSLKSLQQNLIDAGYANPAVAQPSGQWDANWASSFRRWDYNNAQQQFSGGNQFSLHLSQGLTAMGWMMPSEVFQGVVGAAKGLVQQVPQTVERGGAAGGAAFGATLGATLGSILPGAGTLAGAGVGAIAGGVIGFLTHLIHPDTTEAHMSTLGKIAESVLPFQEYKQNSHALWEDLTTIATATLLASGVGAAASAAGAGIAGIGAAAEESGGGFLGAALASGGPAESTGLLTRITEAAIRPFSSPAAENLDELAKAHGFMAQIQRPLIKDIIKPVFTEAATHQFGIRAISDLGQGTDQTTIHQAIDTAPSFKTGIKLSFDIPGLSKIPILGAFAGIHSDLSDLPAFVGFFPDHWLPVKGSEAARAVNGALGDSGLFPFVHVAQADSGLAGHQATSAVKTMLGDSDAQRATTITYTHLQRGIDALANQLVHDRGLEVNSATGFSRFQEQRRLINKAIQEEAGTKDPLTHAGEVLEQTLQGGKGIDSVTGRVMSYAINDPTNPDTGPAGMAGWLLRLGGKGSGLDRMSNYFDANRVTQDLTGKLRSGELEIPYKGSGIKQVPTNEAKLTLSKQLEDTKREIAQLKKTTASGAAANADPTLATSIPIRLETLVKQQKDLETQLKAVLKPIGADPAGMSIVPMRKDTPTAGVVNQARKEYTDLRNAVLKSPKGDSGALAASKGALEDWLLGHRRAGTLPTQMIESALRAKKPTLAISDYLRDAEKHAPREVTIGAEEAAKLDQLGYKPVLLSHDNIIMNPDAKVPEILGTADYTRRQAVWGAFGLGVDKQSNHSIGELRFAHQEKEIQQVLDEGGVQLRGQDGMARIYAAMKARDANAVVDNETVRQILGYSSGTPRKEAGALGPFLFARDEAGKALHRLWALDPRDLTEGDIENAFADVKGFTPEMGKQMYGAVRRGAALGHDLQLRHPVDAAHALADAMRVNGLPGTADVIRAWHTKSADARDVAQHPFKVTYDIPQELRGSEGRAAFETDFRSAVTRIGVDPNHEKVLMMMFDRAAENAVKFNPERFPTADSFYKSLGAGYAEKYLGKDDELNSLFKRIIAEPSYEELRQSALNFKDERQWYENGSRALAALPFHGTTVLRNGREIPDLELYTNILAAVSPRIRVEGSVDLANKVFESIKRGDDQWPSGIMGSVKGMLRDIEAGNTIDKWGPSRFTDTLGKVHILHGRQKVESFYQNLMGNLDRVTNDSWMSKLFGYDGNLTKVQYDDVERKIQALAVDLKWKPAQVQAALWGSIREKAVAEMRTEALRLQDSGDLKGAAAMFKESVGAAHMDPFSDFTPRIEEMLKRTDGDTMLQRVNDNALGATKFGPDYEATMRFFSSADFSTVVHEYGHVVRRILPPDALKALEDHYGVGRAVSPHGASDDLRSIVREYHQEHDIPFNPASEGEYANVNEARAKRIADAFENTKPNPTNPVTKASYAKFASETMDQYDLLRQHGYELVPWAGKGQPYKNAAEFIRDVRENKRIYYFKTLQKDAFGKGEVTAADIRKNPLLKSSGVVVKDSAGKDYEQTYNDVFRGVHDIFAHVKEGFETGPRGEENAWRQHAAMYSPEARRAMTTETRGQNSWVNFGAHLRDEEGNIPAKGQPGHTPLQKRPFADQKVMLLPEEMSRLDPVAGDWTRTQEERFANDMEKYVRGGLSDRKDLAQVKSGLGGLWARFRGHINAKALVDAPVQQQMDNWFGDSLRDAKPTHPSAGFIPPGLRPIAVGAVGGAALGAIYGDDKTKDMLHGAAFGAVAGLGMRHIINKNYGYLPDYLTRINSALRYSLSPAFEVRRFTKQNLLAATKFDLPVIGNSRKYIEGRTWKSMFNEGKQVTGSEAWSEAQKVLDQAQSRPQGFMENIDDLDRTMSANGILGYNPQQRQVAHAYLLAQKGYSASEVRTKLADLYQYGTGRTNIEKTVNYLFFPFSFEKKVISAMGDFILQAPGRNLLLYEGLQRYQESKTSKEVGDFLQRHVPFLQQLNEFNAFAHGLSPGRFLFSGVGDHRTGAGSAAQIAANFFVPGGGAAGPLTQTIGGLGDLAINAFIPVALTGESIAKLGTGGLGHGSATSQLVQMAQNYVPFAKDLTQFWNGAADQAQAFMHGEGQWNQLQDLQEKQREFKAGFEPLATALGYSSVDGFFSSNAGAGADAQYKQYQYTLQNKYPAGFSLMNSFDNVASVQTHAAKDLAAKPDRSAAEDAIINLMQTEDQLKQVGQLTGNSVVSSIMTQASAIQLRSTAEKFAADPRFNELWNEFFAQKYGPLSMTKAVAA